MSDLKLDGIEAKAFTAKATLAGGRISASLKGTADTVVQADLSRFIAALHAEAVRLKITDASVDFRDLAFMNSSCFKVFVTWLNALSEMEEAARYRVKFLADPGKHWQRRSLTALRDFGGENVSVEPPLE